MADYPKTKYHLHGGGSIRVISAAQEKALGAEWRDFPNMPVVDVQVKEQAAPKRRGRPPKTI